MLKILVDQGYELAQPCPPTLFCLLEFDGVRLATSHNEVRNGKVKFNEEAEFQIKKSGNLRIQLCSVDGKKSVLSLNEHKLYGRGKCLIDYNDTNQQKTTELQLKSKSGKDRAKIKFKLTIPANPNYDGASNLLAQQALSTNSLNRSATSLMSPALTPKKVGENSFGAANRNGSMRSEHSSQDYGSRRSLDSAGFENNNPFDDTPMRTQEPDSNPFGSASNLDEDKPDEDGVKRREKKTGKSSNKFGRNSLISSLGLGSHKEHHGAHEEEIARLRQENEWYGRQNKILQEDVASKDKEVKDLNLYIESLLVKIMTKAPEVLQS